MKFIITIYLNQPELESLIITVTISRKTDLTHLKYVREIREIREIINITKNFLKTINSIQVNSRVTTESAIIASEFNNHLKTITKQIKT